MNIDHVCRILGPAGFGLAVLFALDSPAVAQGAMTKDPSKPAVSAPSGASSYSMSQSGDATTLPVTGLSKDDSSAVKTALENLSHTLWRCPDCKLTQAEQGSCPMCKKELVSEKDAVLKNISVDAEKGTIGFGVAKDQTVRLSELESALSAQKVSISRDKLSIGPNSTLVVSGVSTEDSVKKLEAELKSSKLFDSVSARLMGTGKPAELTVKGGGMPTTRAKVEEALAKASPDFKLVDIQWGSPSPMAMGGSYKSKG